MIERVIYQCEHCKKFKKKPRVYFSKNDMYLHESFCFYNTDNKTCLTCLHNNYGRHDSESGVRMNICALGVEKTSPVQLVSDTVKRDCPIWEFKGARFT